MSAKKKRKKVTRHKGTHTHGRGAKKKARGKGHRGGIGKSGTGKRGDQKKTKVTKSHGGKYFGRDKTRRAGRKEEVSQISLEKIIENINSFVKKGLAKGKDGSYELDLKAYKIIGKSDFEMKLKINAGAASEGARNSVIKAGGEIIIEDKKRKKKV
jgi:large subunit ribosomal protein L15